MSGRQLENDGHAPGESQGKPTLDGRRIRLADLQSQVTTSQLNHGDGAKPHWLKRFWAACNDFLAGMYTGESCAGTPHSERNSLRKDITDVSSHTEQQDESKQLAKKDS